jgi:diphosphoinositol-polyphosphate diphosphatase
VPYRVKKDEANPRILGDVPGQVEVLMVSTPNRADMVFPKVPTAPPSLFEMKFARC